MLELKFKTKSININEQARTRMPSRQGSALKVAQGSQTNGFKGIAFNTIFLQAASSVSSIFVLWLFKYKLMVNASLNWNF
jgi:hypothetical protein